MQKDYNSHYLKDTEELLIDLKRSSYSPFLSIQNGTIAELGCGTGDDAIRIADSLSGRDVNVIGFDHDSELIGLARRKLAGMDLDNVRFEIMELDEIDTSHYQFDGIRAERLIQHLRNPDAVIGNIYQMLKPGGTFLMVETDWPGLNLYDSSTSIHNRLVAYLTEKKVNNGFAARTSIRKLSKVGFGDIQMTVIPFVIDSLELANVVIKLEECLEEAAECGFISEMDRTSYISELKELNRNRLFRCQMNMVQIEASK